MDEDESDDELSDESELDSDELEESSFFFFLSVDFFTIDFFHLFNSASIFSRKTAAGSGGGCPAGISLSLKFGFCNNFDLDGLFK